MNQSRFVYVTFIRTTPSKLWQALTDPKIVRQWRFGMTVECAWKKGSSWKMTRQDGTLTDSGQIQEIDPPRRIVIHWQVEWMQDLKAEGPSRCIFELEPTDGAVKLSLTHEMDRPESQFIGAVSVGWPMVLSNLKSLLETGEVVLTSHPGH